ncbi:hypothetical protein HOE31_03940, partial [bacterium]|nr:hypothetical protein [bacterium]
MEITIDLSLLTFLANNSLGSIIWNIFSHGGWLVLVILIFVTAYYIYFERKKQKFINSIEHTMLAIDIPKDNEQSLVAVEQIFAHLTGIGKRLNLIEKYIKGETPLTISLEIISLEGYIQFLIRTPVKYKDLVEASIYAQYPEAEITEVEDYISMMPDDVHDKESDFNIWGTEFRLAKEDCYPIKTYRNFEHPLTQIFVDPMAALLEVMSKLSKGEQLGIQLVIQPISDNWKEKGYHLVKKLIGEKSETKDHIGDKFVKSSLKTLEAFSEGVIKIWGDIEEKDPDRDMKNLIQNLTPGEKNVVEAIQHKLSQLTFATKLRVYYLAHNEVFHKGRGVSSVVGAINQFSTSNLNSFKKDKNVQTKVEYFFKKRRV